MSEDIRVQLSDVSCTYMTGTTPVLANINLSFYPGELVLITGPSGGGKSTLLNLINGIIPHSQDAKVSGEIRFDGALVTGDAASRSRIVGSVLQNADLQIIFDTVEDELAFPLENLGVSPELIGGRIESVAAEMGLRLGDGTRTLSGGQKQRLITAATLSMGQVILLLDEPLANLDVAGTLFLLETLRRKVEEEGFTVLLVEHRLDLALPYADRVVTVEKGEARLFKTVDAYRAASAMDDTVQFDRLDSESASLVNDPLLSLVDTGFRVEEKDILSGVNFTLRRGDRVILRGENGSGKTTLLKLLAGLIQPTSGYRTSIYPKKNEFRHIGFVLQNPSVQLFTTTVRDELAFGAADPAFTEALIEIFALTPILERHPHSLSEGQKRKVGVASILAGCPDVLLLDEPTVGQDVDGLAMMLRGIEALNRRKPLTTVTVTHDERCMRAMGDMEMWL